MTWARMVPALASATPRSRYLKKSRRPLTSTGSAARPWAIFCPDALCPDVLDLGFAAVAVGIISSFEETRTFAPAPGPFKGKSPASDDAPFAQIADLAGAVAKFAEYRLVVLAEFRPDAGPGGRLGELPGAAMHLQSLAVLGIIDLGDIAVVENVGIVGGFEQRVDGGRDDVGRAQPRHPVVAAAAGEEGVEQREKLAALVVIVDDDTELLEALGLERVVEAQRRHGLAPVVGTDQLEDQRLAVTIVERGAETRPFGRAGDAGLAGHWVLFAPHGGGEGPAHQADLAAEQREVDLLADAGGARIGERGQRPAEGEEGARLIGHGDDAGAHLLAG